MQEALAIVRRVSEQSPPDLSDERLEAGIDWVRYVFSSVQKNGEPILTWSSIPQTDVLPTAGEYQYSRVDLRNAVARYVNEMPWLHCSSFDWLLANMLTHAEVSATSLFLGYSSPWANGKAKVSFFLLKLGWGLFVWGVWIAILLALLLFDLPWIAAAWVGLTLVRQAMVWSAKRKRSRLMISMVDGYHSTNTKALSWTIVWDTLTRSRDLGAVWDQELYQLVESRKR
jgi:hypothetical protein